eukprot:Opistho-2@28521
MVGGLVEEENVRAQKHRTSKRKLHLPASRQGTDGRRDVGRRLIGEADRVKHGGHLLTGNAAVLEESVGVDVVEHGKIRKLSLDVSLDENGANLVLGGEAVDLVLSNGAEKRRLARVILADKSVAVSTHKLELRVVEENLRAISERKGGVAELLRILLFVHIVDSLLVNEGLVEDLVNDLGGHVTVHKRVKVRDERVGPCLGLKHLDVEQRKGKVAHKRLDVLGHIASVRSETSLDNGEDGGGRRKLVHVLLEVALLDENLVCLLANVTALGVRHLVLGALEEGEELGEERRDIVRVVDQLGHVLNDAGALALGGRRALDEAADEEGGNHREGSKGDRLHKGRRRKLVDSLGNVLGVLDRVEEVGDEGLDVAVVNGVASSSHRSLGRLLDLGLKVPHGLREEGDKLAHRALHLERRVLDELGKRLHPEVVRLPPGALAEEVGEDRAHCIGVQGGDNGLTSLLRSNLDGAELVSHQLNDGREKGKNVRNDGCLNLLAQRRDADAGALARVGTSLALLVHVLGERRKERGLVGLEKARRLDVLGHRGSGFLAASALKLNEQRGRGGLLGSHSVLLCV